MIEPARDLRMIERELHGLLLGQARQAVVQPRGSGEGDERESRERGKRD
jgi:hypothetical protein